MDGIQIGRTWLSGVGMSDIMCGTIGNEWKGVE